eukprot:TRINITY_DN4456_c0_g1_i1.p1 TRINITY_DN4456_c0_g1~~TRINITY_DN4456_c0_g1_i1.p1  ORF type:complete len:293 (+),score=49.08 TRINITY_DN4456_c0_g1_i1:696-1574(+)
MISHIMAIGMSFRMLRTDAFNELTPYGTMSKMKKDRQRREELCDQGLYRACQIGDLKMAQVWLTRGGTVNTHNYDAQDRTPLHAAVIGNTTQHSALVALLLSKEADPLALDETGKCVLDWAPRAAATAAILAPLKLARARGEPLFPNRTPLNTPASTPRDAIGTPRLGTGDDDSQCTVDGETETERETRLKRRRALMASSYNASPSSTHGAVLAKAQLGFSPSSASQEDISPTPGSQAEDSLRDLKGQQLRQSAAKASVPSGRSSARLQAGTSSGRASKMIGFKKSEPRYIS